MTNYVVPSGVRIADASRIRLGAYLGEGTTVMHEGFVNFNAGALGPNMVEGRISQGVVIGAHSDLGGSSSTMGTLSGGGEITISIGERCLIGANAGTGIPLGDRCTIEAGLYITASTPIMVLDETGAEVKRVKGRQLAGGSDLLFIRNGLTGPRRMPHQPSCHRVERAAARSQLGKYGTVDTLSNAIYELTCQLIERPSVTPDDAGCQTLLAERLTQQGFELESAAIGRCAESLGGAREECTAAGLCRSHGRGTARTADRLAHATLPADTCRWHAVRTRQRGYERLAGRDDLCHRTLRGTSSRASGHHRLSVDQR